MQAKSRGKNRHAVVGVTESELVSHSLHFLLSGAGQRIERSIASGASRALFSKTNGVLMRKHLPGTRELFIFATLAIILSAVVKLAPQPDAALSLLAAPLFVFAAVLGLWKSGRLRPLSDDDESIVD
jgi:hypothetical protein